MDDRKIFFVQFPTTIKWIESCISIYLNHDQHKLNMISFMEIFVEVDDCTKKSFNVEVCSSTVVIIIIIIINMIIIRLLAKIILDFIKN